VSREHRPIVITGRSGLGAGATVSAGSRQGLPVGGRWIAVVE
jgi:hypothetical protein